MALDVEAGVSRDVFYPIANALHRAAHPDNGELSERSPAEQELRYAEAHAAFQATLEQLDPRTRYNVQLIAQVRRLPFAGLMAITAQDMKTSEETRRALLVRALKIELAK